ncbi:MAG: TssQ family T6SS-associated lipoprotein [Burkholderiaceae bacterium]|nr:TssQ family T6SS-associated lipoprotein [Burkholderiaceae bacterium]
MRTRSTLVLAIAALAIAGCSTIGDIGRKAGIGPVSPAEQKVAEGVALYDEGDFTAAIRTLQSQEIADGDVGTRVRANKYLAFSYCVTQRRVLCRRSFDTALRLDESFELEAAEAGHPIWGPVYAQARKAAEQRRNRR